MPALYLLRHGIPEPQGDDPSLTEEGVALMEAEARGIAALGLRLDTIFSSPMRRARQTAGIVAEALGLSARLTVHKALSPGCRLGGLGRLFRDNGDDLSILLVGHQPDLGRIASDLIGDRETLHLDRGTLVCLEVAAWPPGPPAMLLRVMTAGDLARG
ncbi:MAG TPA: histidine phosphatase family protein [Patescibacteria group bacterium]|nr:histidine phosphatase family protein [Patescibacteria group bacterium]